MIQVSTLDTSEIMQEQMALVSGSMSVAAPEASLTSEPRNPNRLTTLPQEMLLEIYHLLPTLTDKSHFTLTCKYLHQMFNEDLYKSACKLPNWLPVFLAARQGSTAALNKFKKLGAPVNIFWNRKHDSENWVSPAIQHGASPLEEAITNVQPGAVKWLLAHRARPEKVKYRCSPLMQAFWMLRKNTIESLPSTQHRTHRNQFSPFAMQKLRVRAKKARRIIDLLRGTGANLSRREAASFHADWEWLVSGRDSNWYEKPSKAAWVTSFDPNSVTMCEWLRVVKDLGLPR